MTVGLHNLIKNSGHVVFKTTTFHLLLILCILPVFRDVKELIECGQIRHILQFLEKSNRQTYNNLLCIYLKMGESNNKSESTSTALRLVYFR